jgi:hypothetical protein
MDRAHRLGQKRTVNVYRLLTRGTLEERIMGLQRFKLDVANAVVNAENASLSAMDTTQVLDLFSLQQSGRTADVNSGRVHTGTRVIFCAGCRCFHPVAVQMQAWVREVHSGT